MSPETSRELYRLGSTRDVTVLDVRFLAALRRPEQGSLTLLSGGEEDSAEAIFTAIGRQHFYMGPSGSGNTMKLASLVHWC